MKTRCFLTVLLAMTGVAAGEAATTRPAQQDFKQFEANRNKEYAERLEAYLRHYLVDEYAGRSADRWKRDYASVEAFVASVEPQRARWRTLLSPPDLRPTGPIARRPHAPLTDLQGEWLTLPLGPIEADALLVLPANAKGRVPLIVAQHGIGSFPERVFGVADDGDAYHSYARELVKAGFAVLAPFNLRSIESRNRVERLCRLADTTLPGIELVRLQRMLDVVLADTRIDADRVGMWGVSLGGMATMFWMPLEPRIKAGVVCAWFNDRCHKMAVPDERYTCFLETKEEHAFFRGWLTEFSDYDVVSLICPRPLLVQHGKKDQIAWWPQVIEEFEKSRKHYERLGIADRMEMDLHDGVHEARVESGVKFLRRWLLDRGS